MLNLLADRFKKSSPRPWRCFPVRANPRLMQGSLLHVRGGVSAAMHISIDNKESSPRPWRCFLKSAWTQKDQLSLLHVRGGVSSTQSVTGATVTSSPRPWRCFHLGLSAATAKQVFSTSVEVFPSIRARSATSRSLLHVRGGVSAGSLRLSFVLKSSPRPWRCFLDGLMEKYFGARLLHVRGGVSGPGMGAGIQAPVFSTSVEVFLRRF